MAPQHFHDGSECPLKALEIIVSHMNRVNRPTYLGALSLAVGYNLARTQEMVDVLSERGDIRPATSAEKASVCADDDHNVYSLVSSARLSRCEW